MRLLKKIKCHKLFPENYSYEDGELTIFGKLQEVDSDGDVGDEVSCCFIIEDYTLDELVDTITEYRSDDDDDE